MLCLGEMATEMPLAGTFVTYGTRFVDEAFGFSLGWNYWFNDAVSLAGDLTAAQVVMQFWGTHLNWLPSLFFWFLLLGLNLIHVKAYGELEYWLSLLKVVTIVIFIILGVAGKYARQVAFGGENWTIGDAPFVGGFGGFASLFVTAAFAYGGTESIGVTAGETKNPSRNMPRVIRRVFYRILLLYVLTVIIIGFNVPYTYPGLTRRSVGTSPFTIVWSMAGSKVAGSFMNAVILTSVLSAGNHALFAGSRILYGLAMVGHAPQIFRRTTRHGVPWLSVLLTASGGIICFGLSFLPGGAAQLWVWLQALVGVSNQIAWLCIGIASWRFRLAWKKQGRSVSDLKFPNPAGRFAAPIVTVATTFIILIQGWSSFEGGFDAISFVQSYIELPIFVLLYAGWKIIKRPQTRTLLQIDLDTGRHAQTAEDLQDDEKIAQREKGRAGWFWRLYSYIA
ncbi:hypothetical protein NMY22_g666 [Coprinellus aureogranulatus]|nr:hypothetical protein NMY22_g666 [Coprinellus aureogranulatus]